MDIRGLLAVVLLATPCVPQEKPKPPLLSAEDQRRVDEAIAKGVAFLRTQNTEDPLGTHAFELVLWTLVHAGVRPGDARFDDLFKRVMSDPLTLTYRVSLQAMILEELDRVKYQKRLFHCAQFLIDNQCKNGQWSYGEATRLLEPPSDDVATGVKNFGDPAAGRKPDVVRKLTVKRTRDGPDEGDNSNSQYAALGLRACHDAGIVLPRESILRARAWWRLSMQEEEVKGRPAVATGPEGAMPPAGWCYGGRTHGHKPYGTMTAGAVGSLAICGFLLGEKNPLKEVAVLRGLAWMGREFTVSANPGPPEHSPNNTAWMTSYWLYAMERAGILAGVDTMGGHKWYPEGVKFLLQQQKGDGSWLGAMPHPDRPVELNAVWDTCFAILFLKRATRPLQDVASTDRFHKK